MVHEAESIINSGACVYTRTHLDDLITGLQNFLVNELATTEPALSEAAKDLPPEALKTAMRFLLDTGMSEEGRTGCAAFSLEGAFLVKRARTGVRIETEEPPAQMSREQATRIVELLNEALGNAPKFGVPLAEKNTPLRDSMVKAQQYEAANLPSF